MNGSRRNRGNGQGKLFSRSISREADIDNHFDRPPVFEAAQTRILLALHEGSTEVPEKVVKPVETEKPDSISELAAEGRHRRRHGQQAGAGSRRADRTVRRPPQCGRWGRER